MTKEEEKTKNYETTELKCPSCGAAAPGYGPFTCEFCLAKYEIKRTVEVDKTGIDALGKTGKEIYLHLENEFDRILESGSSAEFSRFFKTDIKSFLRNLKNGMWRSKEVDGSIDWFDNRTFQQQITLLYLLRNLFETTAPMVEKAKDRWKNENNQIDNRDQKFLMEKKLWDSQISTNPIEEIDELIVSQRKEFLMRYSGYLGAIDAVLINRFPEPNRKTVEEIITNYRKSRLNNEETTDSKITVAVPGSGAEITSADAVVDQLAMNAEMAPYFVSTCSSIRQEQERRLNQNLAERAKKTKPVIPKNKRRWGRNKRDIGAYLGKD